MELPQASKNCTYTCRLSDKRQCYRDKKNTHKLHVHCTMAMHTKNPQLVVPDLHFVTDKEMRRAISLSRLLSLWQLLKTSLLSSVVCKNWF